MRSIGRTLSTRMVIAFSALLAAIGVFMLAFFPHQMVERARQSAMDRGVAIGLVMSTAIAPAIEFDDAEHAASILAWLESNGDARFALVVAEDGTRFATWHPERIPAQPHWPSGQHVELGSELLVVSVPVEGRADGRGSLHVGFSLDDLERERVTFMRTITMVVVLVVLIGVVITSIATAVIVRPIRRITSTAQQIARGELPPQLPPLPGNDEVAQMATALRAMLERIHERSQHELLRASRHAGMAEVATGVLHNVGNVLNSVNVSVELMRERAQTTQANRLRQLVDLLGATDVRTLDAAKLDALRQFVEVVARGLEHERSGLVGELEALRGHIDHIKRVVAMQNAYARQGGVIENTRVRALIDEAVQIACPSLAHAGLEVVIDAGDDTVAIDRHRVLHIVVNLISNARDSLAGAETAKRVAIRARTTGGKLEIAVRDDGMGFSPETAARLFGAGFTTKKHGHGYGLHSSALSARQLGGELTAASDGIGRGATFTLTLPLGPRAEAT